MTTEQLYKKADKADEMADPDIKDMDKTTIARACYDVWVAGCKDVIKDENFFLHMARNRDLWEEQCEPLYRQACSIIAPYREKVNGTFNTSGLKLKRLMKKDHYFSDDYPAEIRMAGIYLSALLNETDLNKLVVDEKDKKTGGWDKAIELSHLGWHMKPGKILEILEGCVTGTAEHAEGGIVVNYASALKCGGHSSDMIIVNYCSNSWGDGAKGSVFINMDDGSEFGDKSENCVLVDFGKTTYAGGDLRADNIYHVESRDIWHSKQLIELGHALEEAGKKRDTPKIVELARKVDEHVRKTRKPKDENRHGPGSF